MIEFLVGIVAAVAVLLVAVLAIVMLPLLLLVGLFKAAFFVVAIPFRLLGLLAGVVLALAAGLGKAVIAVGSVLFGIVLVAAALIALPLVPLLIFAGAIWLMVRLLRPRPALSRA